jgi:hypothetical protein
MDPANTLPANITAVADGQAFDLDDGGTLA